MLSEAGAAAFEVLKPPKALAADTGTTISAPSMTTKLRIEIQLLNCLVFTPEILPDLASTKQF
jgi:hypothetical protein